VLEWRMGLRWLPGYIDVPAVHDGEPGHRRILALGRDQAS
jgi:hypothetical protein